MMAAYGIGARVRRLEERIVTEAIVTAVRESSDGILYELTYDEGGSGWWPESALEALP